MGWAIFYGLLFLLGAFIAYSAFVQYQKTQRLLDCGIRTTAKVIDLRVSQSDDGTTYRPVFEYTDRTLVVRTFESQISSSPAPYTIGDTVKIIYNPKEKDAVKTVSFWGLFRWSVILSMIAAPLLIIGGSYLLYISR
tara:strand:- start:109541 stop:109951 length:411 start_codon:yes stop_codon:yes gene_type:complete